MKITQEEFNDLKQLDRIEFLLREKKLNDNFTDYGIIKFILAVLYVLVFVAAFSILLFPQAPEAATRLTFTIPIIIAIAKVVVIVLVVAQVIEIYFYLKNKEKLVGMFFKTKTKGGK
jgi:hypothetical protein